MLKISRFLEDVDLNKDELLLFSTRSGELQHLKKSIFEHLQKGDFSKISQPVVERLVQSKILVPADENEYIAIINNIEPESSDVLSFTLLPTADCQLGCLYCGQVHEKNQMDKEMCGIVIYYITNKLKSNQFKKLDITWYGAEPLLNIEAIELISNDLINYCQSNSFEYSSSMVTNGLALTEPVFVKMVNLGIKIGRAHV